MADGRGWPVRILVAVTFFKIGFALLAIAGCFGPVLASPALAVIHGLVLITFGGSAAWLLAGAAADRRVRHLGVYFLTLGTIFADRPILGLAGCPSPLVAALARALSAVQPDALGPLFLWLFLADFPRLPGPPDRLGRWFARLSAAAAAVLVLANLLSLIRLGELLPARLLQRNSGEGYYWLVIIVLALPALPNALWRARHAPRDERHRVALLLGGIAAGILPMSLEVLAEMLLPGFHRFMDRPAARLLGGLVLYPLLLSIPITAAYAVRVHRALDVRAAARRAIGYALARSTVLAVALVPFVWLIGHVYLRRDETVTRLLSGQRPLLLLAASALGALLLRLRRDLVEQLDRRFFREQYDARRILDALVEKSRAAASAADLGRLWVQEIDRALHLEAVAVLLLDGRSGRFAPVAGPSASLAAASALLQLLEANVEPVEVDLLDPRSLLRRLPEEERGWLVEAGARLLAPLHASDGSLIGVIVLGDKRSELPFSGEDRALLRSIAASGALVLENRLLRSTPSHGIAGTGAGEAAEPGPGSDEPAVECSGCLALEPAGLTACPRCGDALGPAPVPLVLHGKFRLDRRIGAGAMGQVYRGVDLALGRPVAVKALPRVTPEQALRLRREARAMAATSHPNLALIYGAETWRGLPLLVCEYLEGGTLDRRIEHKPLDPASAIDLGVALSDALEHAHQRGILHRDIKPSNIGFTRDGVPKLLDFGLARMIEDTRAEASGGGGTAADLALSDALTRSWSAPGGTGASEAGRIVGTPLYLSPEAVRGEAPRPEVDLWALAVVLLEAITGKSPFAAPTVAATLRRISIEPAPDLARLLPGSPPALAKFFRRALATNRRLRPASARELKADLVHLRAGLAG